MFIPFLKDLSAQFHKDIAQALQEGGDGLQEMAERTKQQVLSTKFGRKMPGEIINEIMTKLLDNEIALLKKDSPVYTVVQVPDSRLTKAASKEHRIRALNRENAILQQTLDWARKTSDCLISAHPKNKNTRTPISKHRRNIVRIRVPDKALTNPLAIARRRMERNRERIAKLIDGLDAHKNFTPWPTHFPQTDKPIQNP